jgi:PTH2 family peptidyl-tRNA hydrolase
MDYKLIVIVRSDLKLSKGKACAQVGHAVLECWLREDDNSTKNSWRSEGSKKIVLKCRDKKELYEINEAAKANGLTTAVIEDAGHTEIAPGTVTCLGIGPDKADKIDKVASNLKPL